MALVGPEGWHRNVGSVPCSSMHRSPRFSWIMEPKLDPDTYFFCLCQPYFAMYTGTMQRLESGDLKLRVRALEAERALTRVQAWQRVVASALVASTLVNVGTVLSVSAMATGATLSFAGAGVFGLLLVGNYLKVVKLEKKEAQLAGAV